MANEDIREMAKNSNVHLWEIGKRLGYKSDSTFSKKLREELNTEAKSKIISIINDLAQDSERCNKVL